MGVKHSKQSVDISSTPKKAGAPVEEVNGKTVEEKVDIKLNGDAEKSNGVNGDVPASNGEIKSEDKEGDAPEAEEKDSEKAKDDEGSEALASKYENDASYEDKVNDSSKGESPKSQRKTSTAEKIRKKFSLRSLKFHRFAPKTSKDEAETSGSDMEGKNDSETIECNSKEESKFLEKVDMVKNSGDGERSFAEQGFEEPESPINRKGTFCEGYNQDDGTELTSREV